MNTLAGFAEYLMDTIKGHKLGFCDIFFLIM